MYRIFEKDENDGCFLRCAWGIIILRHKLNMTDFKGMCFYFLVKTHSPFCHSLRFVKVCVAASGVMRFSVRSFGCALFCCNERKKENGIIDNNIFSVVSANGGFYVFFSLLFFIIWHNGWI